MEISVIVQFVIIYAVLLNWKDKTKKPQKERVKTVLVEAKIYNAMTRAILRLVANNVLPTTLSLYCNDRFLFFSKGGTLDVIHLQV